MLIVRSFKDGDQQAFESLYRRYYKKVYLFIRKHVPTDENAEDLLHDVFIKLWENKAKVKVEAPIEAQIYVIAKNIMVDYYRRRALKGKVYEEMLQKDYVNDDKDILSDKTIRRLHHAIDSLPPKRREIFKMSKFEGLTYQEIADMLNISKNTVESQMVKALKHLREKMAHLPFF